MSSAKKGSAAYTQSFHIGSMLYVTRLGAMRLLNARFESGTIRANVEHCSFGLPTGVRITVPGVKAKDILLRPDRAPLYVKPLKTRSTKP